MTFASPSSPSSPTQWTIPEDRSAPRPQPPRRPSAMRSSSSDHIITPAVTRFDPETADIPPSPTFPNAVEPSSLADAPSLNPSTTKPPFLEAPPPAPPLLSHRAATSPVPTTKVNATSPPTSLLARRRSSRSTARPNFLPKLDDLKLPSLPVPPLEELDDTVVPEVIGVGSQATTPHSISPTSTRDSSDAPFKPTRSYASTPFPKGRRQSFFDEESDEDRESGNSDDEDGRSTAESSVLDESTDGIRRFSFTEKTNVDEPSALEA